MRCLASFAIALTLALQPAPVSAGSAWGSAGYGDPPSWCTKFSDMWTATVVTNDPLVGTNPEQDTFYGFHANPGYDDWYGFFYGDFRGTPGDSSGWVRLLHETYPRHYHWNFATNGWAVHGHVKQYIAYYNWTFGGRCGLGAYGNNGAPPYMADQYGYPVVDIYVDAIPPFDPKPYATTVTPNSVAFSWDPVADRGDGAGRDYFASGVDHYVSWLTVSDQPGRLQLASTSAPRTLSLAGMAPRETACLHVQAVDRVQNSTADQASCAAPLAPPPMPVWPAPNSAVVANPNAVGLVGLDTWFWLAPSPATLTVDEPYQGTDYVVTATPVDAIWNFGDGGSGAGFGQAYPQPSSVAHTYEAHSQAGYAVRATIRYEVAWSAVVGGRSFGPYPLGSTELPAQPLVYPVKQAEPELIAMRASSPGPTGQSIDVNRDNRAAGSRARVLLIPLHEKIGRASRLGFVRDDPRRAVDAHPPEPGPVLFVVVGDHRDGGIGRDVLQAREIGRPLRFRVDGEVQRVALEREHDRNNVRPSVIGHRGESRDPGLAEVAPRFGRFHAVKCGPHWGYG